MMIRPAESALPQRRSLRLRGYDYAQAGAYFVTICTQGRACLFGDVVDGDVHLNAAWRMVAQCWQDIPNRFPDAALDEFVVMPNHLHGIIVIVGAQFIAPNDSGAMNSGAMNRAPTVGEMVRSFKAVATRMLRQIQYPSFAWQRNYYEHIIRNEDDLARIREYIVNNPLQWALDRENPTNSGQARGEP